MLNVAAKNKQQINLYSILESLVVLLKIGVPCQLFTATIVECFITELLNGIDKYKALLTVLRDVLSEVGERMKQNIETKCLIEKVLMDSEFTGASKVGQYLHKETLTI